MKPLRPPINVLCVQSYGFIEDHHDNSSGAAGSRARLLHAASLVASGTIPKAGLTAFFPQGWRPDQEHLKDKRRSLGEMMANFLLNRPEMDGVHFNQKPMGYGTIDDVRNVYEEVRRAGVDMATFYFVSDPVHIKRVEMIWNRINKEKGFTAKFFGAPGHRMSWKERLIREPVARFMIRFDLDKRMRSET